MQYNQETYVPEVIAKRNKLDSVQGVPRAAKMAEGPLTYSRVIGEFVRRERERRGWTQPQLAAESGMKQPEVSKLERGMKNVSAENMETLLAAFGIKPADIFLKLAGVAQELEREMSAAAPVGSAKLPPPPPTHTVSPKGFRKKHAAEVEAASETLPTTHRGT